MKRKEFLSAAGTLLAAATIPFKSALAAENPSEETAAFKIPPYLKPGDTIGITSPAGFTTLEKMQPAIQQIESWGYKIKIGATAFNIRYAINLLVGQYIAKLFYRLCAQPDEGDPAGYCQLCC